MDLSIAGFLVTAFLFLTGYLLGAPLIIGLFASMPFGATAFATLTAIGGSSPLIYALFAIGIIASVMIRRDALKDLSIVFMRDPISWIVVLLALYVIASAILFPRLFAGQTTAFVPVEGVITELPLSPTSGNITQTAYFILGILTFLAFSILLLREETLKFVTRGFFAFVVLNAALGIIDLAGKLAGAGDLLSPIRTASFSLLTEVEQAGFWRIAGGYSEASAFGAASLACLGFTYAYWRTSKSIFAFILTVVLLLLVLLSTSTTAYAGLAVLCLAPMASLAKHGLQNRFRPDDLLLVVLGALAFTAMLGLFLYNQRLFEPFIDLFQTTILDKPLSESGLERSYWNAKSLEAFLVTGGLGIGMGSSRSSSWIVSVLSQLGILGTLIMLLLVGFVVRGMRGLRPARNNSDVFALAEGTRASALASLIAASIAGGSADPGILFLIALSVLAACRQAILKEQ